MPARLLRRNLPLRQAAQHTACEMDQIRRISITPPPLRPAAELPAVISGPHNLKEVPQRG